MNVVAVIGDGHSMTIYELTLRLRFDPDMTNNSSIHAENISILLGLQAWD